MKILNNCTNSYNHTNFGSGLNPEHLEFVKNLDTRKIEQNLKHKHNIRCNFRENQLVAGLSSKTVDIFHSLNKKLPICLNAFVFKNMGEDMPNEKTTAYTIFEDTGKLVGTINFNTGFFGKTHKQLKAYDLYCDLLKPVNVNTHVLQTFAHEFLHAEQFLRLKEKITSKDIQNIKQINFISHWEEISKKAGYYATNSPLEFYANYWAREICDSLDENWIPKYNPFEEPKIILSNKLRGFLDAVGEMDIKTAQKLAKSTDEKILEFSPNCFKIFPTIASWMKGKL